MAGNYVCGGELVCSWELRVWLRITWLGMGYVVGSYVCSWEWRMWWGVTFVAGNYVCGGE